MRTSHLLFVILCSVPRLTAFGAATQHGDAVLVKEHGLSFLPKPADHLDFPKTSLSKIGTYEYRVENLPQVIYPSGFLLDVPEQEDERGLPHDHPWKNCVVRASLLDTDGLVLRRRTYHLGRDRSGSSMLGRRSSIFFRFVDHWRGEDCRIPQRRSYLLKIEILRPSERATDTLRVDPYIDGDLKT